MTKLSKSDAEWRALLTPEEYNICRLKGTERPFTGEYNSCYDEGTYICICCGNPLFFSNTKFDSGSGWPSFFNYLDENSIATQDDLSHSMKRTEVVCKNCNAHLGHVFNDGPEPTGLRYCINSISIKLEED